MSKNGRAYQCLPFFYAKGGREIEKSSFKTAGFGIE